MNLDFNAFASGAGHFILAFGIACLLLAIFKRVYQISTPYDESRLIGEGNTAAAIALFTAWGLLAGVIQILASLVVRRFIVRDMTARIESGNVASAVYLAATAIGVGLLNAASMTY
jgi:putative membrane protein